MKRALIIGIIAYIFGLVMIMTGLYTGVKIGNIALVTLKDKLTMVGMCMLIVFGELSNAIGYILIKLYLVYKD